MNSTGCCRIRRALLITLDRFGDNDFSAALRGSVPEAATGMAGGRSRYPALREHRAARRHSVTGAFIPVTTHVAAPRRCSACTPGVGPGAADDAIIIYTSGSSSRPKSVPLSHGGIIENGFNIGERQGYGPDDRVLLAPPLFWSYGSANAMSATLTHGAALGPARQVRAGRGDRADRAASLHGALHAARDHQRHRLASRRSGRSECAACARA